MSMTTYLNATRRMMAAVLVIGLGAPAALAQDAKKDSPPAGKTKPVEAPPQKAGNVADAADLEAFFDGVLNVQLQTKHIAGAVVAVVVGDRVVFMKGYGYADVDARKKVDPATTMFHVGSVSKLFTWTAVMQQVEAGKLDLNADVNNYLKDVKIPPAFEQPVTLQNLLTHTPGFEDVVIGLFAHKAEDMRPLGEVLKTQMPARVRPPGSIASYSNHGTAIAGYAVACVAGQSWEDYIEQRILKPLGMEHTQVRQPPEDKLPDYQSKGYKWADGRFESKVEYIPAAPAGCISMSGGDAAKFMIAHLNDGQAGGGRILKAETARRMREPLFRHDPKLSAMCYGFMEQRRNGQRLVGHGGDTFWFHTLMQLIPERRVGLFVSYNTDTGGGAREPLFEAFLDRYFPVSDPQLVEASSDFCERNKRLAGEYGITRYSHTSVAKLGALLSVVKVKVNDDDTLTIGGRGSERRFVEVEPLVFRERDGQARAMFKDGADGKVEYFFLDDWPPMSAVRRQWHERTEAQWGLLGGSMAIFASALIFWPVIAFSVRGLDSPYIRRTGFSGFLSFLAWLLSAASIGMAVAMVIVLQDPMEIAYGIPTELKYVLAVPQVCAVLAGVTVLGCLVAWVQGYWRFTGRVHFTLVALAGVGFTWFLHHWNLLTFGFKEIVN